MAGPNKTGAALGSEQSLATDPFADATLSASAGTGKTHVLTSRVFRLLLNGAAPESILCLTFTKAGAAAMAERIGTRLARWVRLSNAELGRELGELGEDIGPTTRERARQLFARVLDAPGGIRIQTIHAFAQSLLAAFPAEAGVTPGFKPIEGRAADELVHRTLSDLMANAESSGNEALIGDVQALSRRLGERDAISYLRLCASREEDMTKFDAATIERDLRVRMGAPDCDVDAYLADHCSDDRFDCALLHAIADANRGWAAKSGLGHVAAIEEWLALSAPERARNIDLIRKVVLTGDNAPRKAQGQSKHDPDYQDKSDQLATSILGLLAIQSACALAADMAAGLRAGQAFAAAYARAKRAAGVADFNDLIGWARDLLEQDGMGDWVRFKLDRRIDHLLVDEAQDTNADQWAIIGALVEDFYSGASDGEERWRTLLMVGDFKQAIYGFQGTNPREFERMRALFKDKADEFRAAEEAADGGVRQSRDFHDLSMSASFRSAQGVLDAVDAMIAVTGWEAMGLPRAPEPHRSAARNEAFAATVELWAPFALASSNDLAAADDDEEGWIDLRERRYAERIAEQISQWINSGERLDSTGAPIKPGDILILVRSRKELASLIVARLFEAGVPVAGIDRLHLHEPLAVQDLLAAMSFAVQPLDDLNLANLLVSPLLGWSQEELLDLAASRKGRLWPALRDRAPGNPRAAEARDVLLQLLNTADYTTAARFLETILSGPIGGRRKLTQRLSMAARDPIDELMSSALQFERDDIPSLERFLAWFRRGDVEIARDASAPANEVRVMTVHGAKGLEAPVVIIADAHADPAKLGQLGPIEADLDGARVPVVRPRKDELVEPFAGIIADHQLASLEEHWRLLYVGLTRAIDRLVVVGLLPASGKLPLASWHSKMGEALERLGASEESHSLWGSVQRYASVGKSPAKAGQKPAAAAALSAVEIPSWANRPAPKEERPPRPLAPSAIAKDDVAAPPPSIAQREAAQRGIWIHALLERLVEVVPEQRHSAAQCWLGQSAGVGDGAQRSEIADQVCGILSDPRYSSLFGVGSLGEAPLAATLADGQVIAGTVDRLLVEGTRVSVIDFKTGRVPRDDSAIPSAHRAQMAAYAAALALIFPGRSVRSALLYTSGPRLFELEA